MSKIHKLYLYSESCLRAGKVYLGDDAGENGDLYSVRGTEETLIAEARERLAARFDKRPGGAGDSYEHRCARSILDWFGADETESDDDSDDPTSVDHSDPETDALYRAFVRGVKFS